MEAALSLVPDDGPQSLAEALHRIRELEAELATRRTTDDLQDEIDGHLVTIRKQSREIGVLTKRLAEEADPLHHPKGKEIVALIERWKTVTNHPNSKIGDDRVKIVKARLKDGFTFEHLELAIDGIGAYQFVVNGERVRHGKPSHRHDRLGIALAGSEKVEEFARLGHRARKEGWTVEGGWPE